jgi:hypothetical protein
LQDYPAENKVDDVLWTLPAVISILSRYNPRPPEFDKDGKQIFDAGSSSVLYDPFEQHGAMLRVCCRLGWRYLCKTATTKIATFINNNWMKHLVAVMSKEFMEEVCFFFLLYVCCFLIFVCSLDGSLLL